MAFNVAFAVVNNKCGDGEDGTFYYFGAAIRAPDETKPAMFCNVVCICKNVRKRTNGVYGSVGVFACDLTDGLSAAKLELGELCI